MLFAIIIKLKSVSAQIVRLATISFDWIEILFCIYFHTQTIRETEAQQPRMRKTKWEQES